MKQAKFNSLSLYITTLCNFHCLGCCAGTQEKGGMTPEEIFEMGKELGEIKDLFITGGEPTLHKNFKAIMGAIVSSISYERIILATNGYGLMKYMDLMDTFAEIRISHYDEESYVGADHNIGLIEEFKAAYKGSARIVVQHIKMIQNDPNKTGVCGRANNGVASYFKDKIYGCCVAAGMDTGKGINFDKNWRQSAAVDILPCEDCVFAK